MALWGIFISAFLIGFSGAMMPGPMLGITIEGSLKKGWIAGPLIVLGHGILEFILITIMAFGLKDFFSNSTVAGFIGLFGGVFLAWMGYGMVKSSLNKSISLENKNSDANTRMKNPVFEGALVSATNPYFVMWWATTGMESVRQSYILGFVGIILFFIGHILSDLIWFTTVSIAFSSGKKLISDNIYRWVIFWLGLFILAFSVYFIGSGWRLLLTP